MKPMAGLAFLAITVLASCDWGETNRQTTPPIHFPAPNTVAIPATAPAPDQYPKRDLLLAAAGRPPRPASGIRVRPNRFVEVNLDERSHPVHYKMGKMNV